MSSGTGRFPSGAARSTNGGNEGSQASVSTYSRLAGTSRQRPGRVALHAKRSTRKGGVGLQAVAERYSGYTARMDITAPENTDKREEIISLLEKAYWMEV